MQRWAKDEAAVQKAREGGGGGQEGRLGLERGGPGEGEGGGGGGKDSPQVDTIAKSHQVQVSRCLHAPRKGTEGRR